jgi:hypothetical protein
VHDEDDFTTIPGAMPPPTTLKRLLLLPSPRAKPGRPRGAKMQQLRPPSALPRINAAGPQSTMPLAAATTGQEGKPCVIPAPPVALDPDARSAMRSAGDRYWARTALGLARHLMLAVLVVVVARCNATTAADSEASDAADAVRDVQSAPDAERDAVHPSDVDIAATDAERDARDANDVDVASADYDSTLDAAESSLAETDCDPRLESLTDVAPSGADGACTGASDLATLRSTEVALWAVACAFNCVLSPVCPPVVECIRQVPGTGACAPPPLSPQCAGCYAAYEMCRRDECVPRCGVMADPCNECMATTCDAAFLSCSGLNNAPGWYGRNR